MKTKAQKFKDFLREEITKAIKETQVQPLTKPKIQEPTPKPKRRSLQPPKETPNTRPKASIRENEKELVKKITQRFKKLSK